MTPAPLLADDVLWIASSLTGLTRKQILGPSRHPELVEVRSGIALYLWLHGWSYPQIGRALRRHHTTVMNLLGVIDQKAKKELRGRLFGDERTA